jgi:putative MATE family efflux protein
MQDLTKGPISRHLLKTMSFMLVGMVFQTLYVLVDLYWVGRLGTAAVAAVALSANLMFVVLAATQMLSVGTTTLVSHAAGSKDQARAVHVFNQSFVLSLVVGAVFLGAAWALRGTYAAGLGADAETSALAVDYLEWFIPAMALQFGMVSLGAALRGIGLFKPGMTVQIGTVVLNMLLAPVLIFGWGTGVALGVAGAAAATFISIVIGTLGLAWYFRRSVTFLRFNLRGFVWDRALWRKLLGIGLPAGAEFALVSAYLLLVYIVSRPFGAAAQAGFGIGLRVIQAAFMPAVALGFAVAPVAGQNYGARLGARVRETFRTAAVLVSIMMAAVGLVLWAVPEPIVRLFTADPDAVRVGVEYMRIIVWNFVASGLVFVGSSTFQALGNTLPPLIASAGRLACLAPPILWLAGRPGFALRHVWYLSVASIVLQAAVVLWLLRREFRRRLTFA